MKKLYGAIAFISWFTMMGAIGGIECNTMTLTRGFIQSILSLIVLILFTYLAGGFNRYKNRRQINGQVIENGLPKNKINNSIQKTKQRRIS